MSVEDQQQSEQDEESGEPAGKLMGFLDHLEELRTTILKSLVAFLIGVGVVVYFFDRTVAILDKPLHWAFGDGPTPGFQRVTTSVMAIFNVYIQVGFLGAFSLSFPFILYFVIRFVAPALTQKEKRMLVPVCASVFLLFLAGASFAYFVLAKQALTMSKAGNEQFGTTLLLKLDDYYSMLVWLILGMGGICQFPVLIQILVYMGILSVKSLRSMRRVMILVCFVAAALITPTADPVNMTICALPLWFLYEVSIIVAVGIERRRISRTGF